MAISEDAAWRSDSSFWRRRVRHQAPKGLAAVAPDEVSGDAAVVADAFERVRPQAEEVDAGTLDDDDFGRDHLQPLFDDPDVRAANTRVESFVVEHCAAG